MQALAFIEIRPVGSPTSWELHSAQPGLPGKVVDLSWSRLQRACPGFYFFCPSCRVSPSLPSSFPEAGPGSGAGQLQVSQSGGATGGAEPPSLDLPPPPLLGHFSPPVLSYENQPWPWDPCGLSVGPERVLLHSGHLDSSEASQDLLGLNAKLSEVPGWERVPSARSMPGLEAEERGERSHSEGPREVASLSHPMTPTPNPASFKRSGGGGSL